MAFDIGAVMDNTAMPLCQGDDGDDIPTIEPDWEEGWETRVLAPEPLQDKFQSGIGDLPISDG